MIGSILTTTKKILGITEDDESFDVDVLTFINTVFADLSQLGVGPENGFAIEDKTVMWATYLGDDLNMNQVPTYMYFRTRLMFDPPATQAAINAMQAQVDKLEFRLSVHSEGEKWVPPVVIPELESSAPIL